MTEHKKIWLQAGDGDERTWCQDKIEDNDTEYVLASALTASEARLKQAEELLRAATKGHWRYDDIDAFLAASEPRQGAQSDAGGDA